MSNVLKYHVTFLSLLTILVFITFASCKKKKTEQSQNNVNHPVPNVPVDVTMYPGDPLNFKIQAIGGWMYINGGVNGIVLYRKSQQEFVALDRTSTYLPENANARVKVLNDNFTCKDTISGSQWQIVDGVVTAGPASWALRAYGTTFDGTVLKIRN